MMTYNKTIKPDFKKALKKANDLLISSDTITTFPFSLNELIKEKTNAVLRSYSKAKLYNLDITCFGSSDAILCIFQGKEIIFYNDNITNKDRKRYSISHELGHLQLNHNLNKQESYEIYEIEANFFAAQLLMPEQIIMELINRGQRITVDNLTKWFSVSKEAAEKRITTLNKIDYSWRTYEEKIIDDEILLKYNDFINHIAPNPMFYYDYDEEEDMQQTRDTWFR